MGWEAADGLCVLTSAHCCALSRSFTSVMEGFTSVELRSKETGKLFATGTHTKALGAGTPAKKPTATAIKP